MPKPAFALSAMALLALPLAAQQPAVLTGKAAFATLQDEAPGVRRLIRPEDLPEAVAKDTELTNPAPAAQRPPGVLPQGPPGFKVTLYAEGFANARLLRSAPNGDVFLTEPLANTLWVLRGVDANGHVVQKSKFSTKLSKPFGLAFYPPGPDPKWVYVANSSSIVRFPYRNGDLVPDSSPQTLVKGLPDFVGFKTSGHWTKDIAFTPDGKHLLVSVGAATDDVNGNDFKQEKNRADILEYTPEGVFEGIYAAGIRNCVGEAINPVTGELWCSTNERNWLGDDLVPDWISAVPQGSFFGWPFWYIGNHLDPLHADLHPKIAGDVRVPDVLLTAHIASLEMLFYPLQPIAGSTAAFPAEYRGDVFAAEHGSGARSQRAGYEVVRAPMKDGHATGEYEDFLTGFTLPDGSAWGRPVGVAVGNDGALYVSEDVSNTIWRVTWTGK